MTTNCANCVGKSGFRTTRRAAARRLRGRISGHGQTCARVPSAEVDKAIVAIPPTMSPSDLAAHREDLLCGVG
jgi:hypothetical protein